MIEINLSKRREGEPSPEIFGKNVELRIFLMRHGEKDMADRKTGRLTEVGKEQFREFAIQKLNDPKRHLIIYGSDLVRTIQSGLEAMKMSAAEVKTYPAPLDELSLNIGSRDPKHKEKLSPDLIQKLGAMPMGDSIKHYLKYRYQRPDEKSFSPRELAEGIVRMLLGYDKKIDHARSETKNDILAVSSDYIIASFLQEALGIDFKKEDTLNFAEGLQFTIRTDKDGTHTYECEFRNKKYSLSKEQLEQWLKI